MKMHPSVQALNKKERPPKGCRHPAYEVMLGLAKGTEKPYYVGYLDGNKWQMPAQPFGTEAEALRWILDRVYYGDRVMDAVEKSSAKKATVKKTQKAKCPCGAELPHHLAGIGLTGHHCSCGEQFTVKNKKFVRVGS